MSEPEAFPAYRKLANHRVFYKITASDRFEELKLMGEKVYHFVFQAEQYPEKLKIMDLLELKLEHYLDSNQEEWEFYRARLKS